jgi:hypothetical protein
MIADGLSFDKRHRPLNANVVHMKERASPSWLTLSRSSKPGTKVDEPISEYGLKDSRQPRIPLW